jgi:UDP-N-acetylglucosamine 2-epimerase (non-hydrolysing)
MFVLGTRPEAVKLAPVIHAAQGCRDWRVRVCSTGQHRELLAPFLDTFAIVPDEDLGLMVPGQGLGALLGNVVAQVERVLVRERPAWIVVQGDTTTVLGASLAAAGQHIPVAHVEAGLRTHDRAAPFPEETNRVLVGQLASLHLCPSRRAVENLRAEGITAGVSLTGNTVVDAVRWIRARLPAGGAAVPEVLAVLPRLRPDARLVLVTGHRRESFDGGLSQVCAALAELAARHPEIDIVYPVHLNPHVRAEVDRSLGGHPNVHVCPPVGYPASIWLISRAHFVITDSGGIQEEAPELGKPVLVTRVATERPEAVDAGAAVVVGYDPALLLSWCERWLGDPAASARAVATHNPFGDGLAAARCIAALREQLRLPHALVPPYRPDGVKP